MLTLPLNKKTGRIGQEALADLGEVPQRVGRDDRHEEGVIARV